MVYFLLQLSDHILSLNKIRAEDKLACLLAHFLLVLLSYITQEPLLCKERGPLTLIMNQKISLQTCLHDNLIEVPSHLRCQSQKTLHCIKSTNKTLSLFVYFICLIIVFSVLYLDGFYSPFMLQTRFPQRILYENHL